MENQIKRIATKIKENGGKLYLVGGAVRDKLLEKEIHDKDYCVVGITAEEFKDLFPESIIRGKSFEVFELDRKEFAMARTEKKNGIGHKEFEITANKEITIEQDLARRDITINSIAEDVLTGELIDPFNGKSDLENKIIRATTGKFKEDPLRVYRVARFATTLQFEVEEETLKMMNSLKDELNTLSPERVFMEFSKALSKQKPSIFFEVLKKANVLDVHFKEIYDLIGALQPIEHHPEGDSFNHTMLVVDKAAEQTDNLEIRFASLVHDLGKGITPKKEYPHHYGHEIKGVNLVVQFGNKLKVPTRWINSGKVACREHMRGGIFYKMRPSKKVEFIERVAKSSIGLHGLQIVVNSDKLSSRNIDEGSIDFETIGNKCLEEINGKFIKRKYHIIEGTEFGNKLHQERIEWMKKT
ncbi:MAG: HD domain-containing protein [Clostridia bacterium]|nr:HD domain-containing protein [Clostridia bacterium]